jgi:hypothetical protein
MATNPSELLGDSLFQVNLLLWMLQPPNESSIRPLLSEAGYKLRSIEEALPLGPSLIAQLKNASIAAKENAAPDAILATEKAEHLLVECKASMFGAVPSQNGSDSNQRQARSFLIQTPDVLRSALAGSKVTKASVAYLTRHDDGHDQSAGVLTLAQELKAAKVPAVDCCVWRITPHEGGIGLIVPKRSEKWPACVRAVCKVKRGNKAVTLIPVDDSGNDLRPLYFIPWMPDSEPQPNEYNRRAFGNRVLGAAVVRVGRTTVDEDVILNFDELLTEVTLGVYGKWRNREAKKSLRNCVRKLLNDHLNKTAALKSDPDGTGQSIQVKLSDEKIKAAVIKVFRETILTEWDKPDPQGKLFEQQADKGEAE